MGCKPGKIQPSEEKDVTKKKKSEGSKDEKIWRADSHRHDPPFGSQPKDEIIEINKLPHDDSHNSQHQITKEIHQNNDTPNKRPTSVDEFVNIVIADPEAFNHAFIEQRQQAITNTSYRSVIESWNPNSLQQLVETIKIFSKGKNLVDRQWIIFYWIAFNIEYDTVSYFSKNYQDQSAEGVFRTRKGVCAGYANIYKYLCDQLQMPCEIVSGYSKGYGFDDREGAPTETDHAWNAVEIYNHWYLMESTWGAGHLDDNKQFRRELTPYYFLPRSNEMIYHHLPENDKWQLLQTPIKMRQYMQMPKLRPSYFDLNLELISPLHQAHLLLVRDKSYAQVLIRTPADVDLLVHLKLHDKKIEGGHRIVFDAKNQFYRCYFAPASTGQHEVQIFAKRVNSNTQSYKSVVDFTLNINELPQNLVSYPETWKGFYNLGLKVLKPINTHLLKVSDGATHAPVDIRGPDDVDLIGNLENSEGQEIEGGHQVYFDQRKCLWKCKFAPDRDGLFKANIFGKKKSDAGSYSTVISFKIEATQIPAPPLSYPHTWQLFHDLNLKVKAPQYSSTVTLPVNVSYVEVLMRTPDDVQLSCSIKYNKVGVKNGTLTQFDSDKRLWQLLFAPERIGQHELFIFAKRDNEEKSGSALKFHLNVTQLHQPMKFPTVYDNFRNVKGRIYEPLDGVLKRDAPIPIHCVIPGATDVNLMVDSKWLKSEGYRDPILRRQITVGSKEVTIYARYGQNSDYNGLVKYTVQ
jgi:hypothetical protein